MLLEFLDLLLELASKFLHALQVVLFKSLELLDIREDIDEFVETSHERVELVEDLTLREVEALAFRYLTHLLLRLIVALLVVSI